MKAILFLASRSRYHIPRVGGFVHAPQFAGLTAPNQPIVYQGRALDMDEFNKVASEFLDRKKPNIGYDVSVRLVGEVEEAKPAPQPQPQPPVEEMPFITPPDAQPFILAGNEIFFEGHRVAMLSETGLRCAKGFADMRERIEAWLASNEQPDAWFNPQHK